MLQRPFGHLLVVHERAVSRAAIFQHVCAVFAQRNLRVLARYVHAGRPQVALAFAADAKHRLVDDDDAAAERVVDLEARRLVGDGVGAHCGLAISTTICTNTPVKS